LTGGPEVRGGLKMEPWWRRAKRGDMGGLMGSMETAGEEWATLFVSTVFISRFSWRFPVVRPSSLGDLRCANL
jgi:hypothetical protein